MGEHMLSLFLDPRSAKEAHMTYYVDANGVVHSSNTLAAKRLGR